MKFTLKDYQETAVGDVLTNLYKARKRWKEDGDKHAFSLTATTGAGKTVMAAAVFEALFYGDDNFNFEADPGAVVIWFSDDPSLNEQSRFRLLEASDKLDLSDLVVVENTFNKEKFEPGKIYFLNTQKLSKTSLLVRGHSEIEEDSPQIDLFTEARPDNRAFTIWDTIKNTIEDPALTLYLLLDEAHRGMGKITASSQKEKSTIVKRLINGSGTVPPIPIVWGISATVSRFNKAVEEAKGRSTLPNVVVDSSKVQASGLLKDTIILDIPAQVGQFDAVLIRRAAEKIKTHTSAWSEYTEQQQLDETVIPLMVLQVPNTPDLNEIGRALDTICEVWPELNEESFANVFGEHTTQTFGRHSVPYVAPQYVQEMTNIRVLIAKDAISTGWDCPRAEVMISFRPAVDRTHITQLLGRMVRTPLARRIPGHERLNSVDCILPFFDKDSVEVVADALMKGSSDEGDSGLAGRRVLINSCEIFPNSDISNEVWQKLEDLPSQSLPKKASKPVKRLTALAQEFAYDNIILDAGKLAHSEMHKVLDAAKIRFADKIETAKQIVLTVEGKSLKADLKENSKSFSDFVEDADFHVINDFFRRASRSISPDLARTYAEYLAEKNKNAESIEEALLEAHTDIASIGLVPDIQEYLDAEADKLAKSWLETNRVAIKSLNDERQDVYRNLKSWSREPQEIELLRPTSWIVPTTVLENQIEKSLPKYESHLMCSMDDKMFPCELNTWETKILENEKKRNGFVAWYRNPKHASQDSLGISYVENKEYQIVRPDFLFFYKNKDGSIAVDIVDPHGFHLSDALPKLKGLAKHAETYAGYYRRIEAVAKIDEQLRVLDLTDANIRIEIDKAENAEALFKGSFAQDY
jgi:type III restriction enzyme